MERAIDVADEIIQGIYKVDILSAMKSVITICKELPASVIRNGWSHTDIVQKIDLRDVGLEVSKRKIEMEMSANFDSLVPPRSWMLLKDISNPAGEYVSLQQENGD